MKVLVTGATGFVGRWLIEELRAAGHAAEPAPPSGELDIQDAEGLASHLARLRPDAVAHLAGISYAPDAQRDRQQAVSVNIGGTQALFTALELADCPVPVLVAGSADVYGAPRAADLPLTESAPLLARHPYGLSKLGQEAVAKTSATRLGVPLVVTRSFNHTGPGQRDVFVAPALARRVLEARARGNRTVRVGNLDVRRDISDVRDVARAYRLLLELIAGSAMTAPLIVNVASGRSTSIRELLGLIAAAVGIEPQIAVDPSLVRPDDPPEIVGDASLLRSLTGWEPAIPLERTIGDLVGSLREPVSSPRRP